MGFAIIIWLGATGVVRFVLMHYMGYLLKAGHIAVIVEAVTTGKVPVDQVNYGKHIVTERFATSNVYFVIDNLVSGAVKQIQNMLQKARDALDFIPGMNAAVGIGKIFLDISLGYIDECCLGYTFYRQDQGAFKSAADGVAIYAQNWKKLLKDAAKTTAMVIFAMIGVTLVIFVVLGLLFKILNWSPLVAFLLSCLVAWTIKFAFIDSWILVNMMSSYMEVAPNTHLTFDLYGKLSNASEKFKELYQKGQHEQSASSYAAVTVVADKDVVPKPVICGECGAKNDAVTKFCGSCGSQMIY